MSEQKKLLMKKAKQKYGRILPCGTKKHFSECFSIYSGKLYFWFNTDDCTTHAEYADMQRQFDSCSISL